MERFKDFGLLHVDSAEYRTGWVYQIRFHQFHAPKTLTPTMIAEWCKTHWGNEAIDLYVNCDRQWWFRDCRWMYMKQSWQVIEFKVRWFGEGRE